MDNRELIKTKIQLLLPSLPKGEKIAADFFLDNLSSIGELNLGVISEKTNVSHATVLRLCKRLGYHGFIDFRNSFRSIPNVQSESETPNQEEKSSLKDVMNAIINENIQTMENTLALLDNEYDRAANAIKNSKRIMFFGNGDAIIPCNLLAMKLMKIGYACTTYSDQDLQIFCANSAQKGDVAIVVSHTGRTCSVVESARLSQQRGATTISVTASRKSPLLKYSDIVLYSGTVDETVGKDKVTRRVAEILILETLYQSAFSSSSEILEIKRRGIDVLSSISKIQSDE